MRWYRLTASWVLKQCRGAISGRWCKTIEAATKDVASRIDPDRKDLAFSLGLEEKSGSSVQVVNAEEAVFCWELDHGLKVVDARTERGHS